MPVRPSALPTITEGQAFHKLLLDTEAGPTNSIFFPDLIKSAPIATETEAGVAPPSLITKVAGLPDGGELTTTLASKADTEALDAKADASAVSALATTVGAKADTTAVASALLTKFDDDGGDIIVRADKTGLISANAGLAAAFALTGNVTFPRGAAYRLSASQEWPANRVVSVPDGSGIYLDSDVTLTVSSYINAGDYPIFFGPGKVVMAAPKPAWFGVKGDYDTANNTGTDNTAALNAYFIAIRDAPFFHARQAQLPGGRFLISGKVTIWLSSYSDLVFDGQGCGNAGTQFFTSTNFPGNTPAIHFRANGADAYPAGKIGGFSVNKATGGSTCDLAIQIGDNADITLNPIAHIQFHDIAVFDIQVGLRLRNCRKMIFDRWDFWQNSVASGGISIDIDVSSSAHFVGDLTFNACQLTGKETGSRTHIGIAVNCSAAAATPRIAGLRFNQCIFYNNLVCMYLVGSAGSMRDIWLNEPQGDASSDLVKGSFTGTGNMGDFHLDGAYLTASLNFFVDISGPDGCADGVFITNNWIRGATGLSTAGTLNLKGVQDFTIIGNQFVDASDATLDDSGMLFENCKNGTVLANIGRSRTGSPQVVDFIKLIGACEAINITGSAAAGFYSGRCVNDQSTGATLATAARNIQSCNGDRVPTPGNMLVNSEFDGTTGWQADIGSLSAVTDSDAFTPYGMSRIVHTFTSAANQAVYLRQTKENKPCLPDTIYEFSFYPASGGITETLAQLSFFDASGNTINDHFSNPNASNTAGKSITDWSRTNIRRRSPSNAVYMRVYLIARSATGGTFNVSYLAPLLRESNPAETGFATWSPR